MPSDPSKRFQLVIPDAKWMKQVKAYGKKHGYNISESIRQLVIKGLEKERKK